MMSKETLKATSPTPTQMWRRTWECVCVVMTEKFFCDTKKKINFLKFKKINFLKFVSRKFGFPIHTKSSSIILNAQNKKKKNKIHVGGRSSVRFHSRPPNCFSLGD